ncbi:hypothetical protein CWC08_19155, partial [Pseudoalteromonas ruthenica]|uniref:hypothetical protein n=1 Tax=Pseudoalteromonas ruthenica TaxID=151081 RepID=UPI00110907F7
YRCSMLYEAVGLSDKVVELCFKGVARRIAGACFEEFEHDQGNLRKLAFSARKLLSHGRLLKYVHGGEYHAYNPHVIETLPTAVRSGHYADYQRYPALVKTLPLNNMQ